MSVQIAKDQPLPKFFAFQNGVRYSFEYTWKGIKRLRTVIYVGLSYHVNDAFPDGAWVLTCEDLDKKATRSFAVHLIDASTILRLDGRENWYRGKG